MKRTVLVTLVSATLMSSAAWAQMYEVPVEEGTAFVPPPSVTADMAASTTAQLEVRLSAIEDELRRLRGKNEELSFQLRKMEESIEKMQRDTDMRFSDLDGGAAMPEVPASDADVTLASPPPTPDATSAGDGVLRLPSTDEFATPRDLYNHAFRLLNQTKYEEAAAAFDAFTKKYPKDPLVGNAYYWQGETFYIRRDYVKAADHFRQGFEALPNGPKAPDNLLKLAMSLDALGQDKEACVVLQQVVAKFKKDSASISDKAAREQKRIGCKS